MDDAVLNLDIAPSSYCIYKGGNFTKNKKRNWMKILFLVFSVLIAISFIAVYVYLIHLIFFTKGTKEHQFITEHPWTFAAILAGIILLFLYWIFVRKQEEAWFLKSIYHVLVLPIGIVFVVLSVIVQFDTKSNPTMLIFFVILMLGVSLVSSISTLRQRHAPPLIEVTRVILDFLDLLYWILFSVLAVVFAYESIELIKFLVIPFLIQVKLVKSILGYLKMKERPKSKIFMFFSRLLMKLVDFRNPHIVKYKKRFS